MSRHSISLSREQLTSFDLDAFVSHANALNQHHRETFTTPFPKSSSRWLSHYHFTLRPLALTTEGDVEGGLSSNRATTSFTLVGTFADFTLSVLIRRG
jgi:hypothetical protein